MILWVKVPLPEAVVKLPCDHTHRTCDEPVRDPSLTTYVGRTTGYHLHQDGTLHVQIELDDERLTERLAERRGAF